MGVLIDARIVRALRRSTMIRSAVVLVVARSGAGALTSLEGRRRRLGAGAAASLGRQLSKLCSPVAAGDPELRGGPDAEVVMARIDCGP